MSGDGHESDVSYLTLSRGAAARELSIESNYSEISVQAFGRLLLLGFPPAKE